MNPTRFRTLNSVISITYVRRLARLQKSSVMMASCSRKLFVAATIPTTLIAQKGQNYNRPNPLGTLNVPDWMVSTRFLPGTHVQNSTIAWRVKPTRSLVQKASSSILQREPAFILTCQPASIVQLTLSSTSSAQIWTNASRDFALVITIGFLIPLIAENSSFVWLMVNHA